MRDLDHHLALQALALQHQIRGGGRGRARPVHRGGSPYSSGVLVDGPNFEYAPATPATPAKVTAIKAIAERQGVTMKAAGLPFALAHPAVAAVIPGASRPERIAEDSAALQRAVPAEFWPELRAAQLVQPEAPLPLAK